MFIQYHQDLIPDETRLWASIAINLGYSDKGDYITKGKTGSYYIALELTILEGDKKYVGKKLRYYLGRKGKPSNDQEKDKPSNDVIEDNYRNMGDNALVKILCTINNITLKDYKKAMESKTPLPFMLEEDYSNLINQKVYIQVGIEPKKTVDGKTYPKSNKIHSFVIPTPRVEEKQEGNAFGDDNIPF